MAALLPATVCIITAVLLMISAEEVVLSTLLPSASFSSIPISSMKAPRVPEPSSREITLIEPLMPVDSELPSVELPLSETELSEVPEVALFSALLHPANIPAADKHTRAIASHFFVFIWFLLLFVFVCFLITMAL